MKISLIISTYNWEDALTLCLNSVLCQTVMPYEILIADDGSGPATTELINQIRKKFSCPLKQVWHEDRGFRKTIIHNEAIRQAKGDYLIFIDGDIILHPKFIIDHQEIAQENYFVIGSRSKLSSKLSDKLLKEQHFKLHFWTRGVNRKLNAIRCKLLSSLFINYKHKENLYGRGCHLAIWKKDLIAVNGFDESYIGWGLEDTDLICRLYNYGLQRHFLKFAAVQFHIHHESGKQEGSQNKKKLEEVIKERNTFCLNGIKKLPKNDFVK